MQILLNKSNEIVSFAIVGGFEDGLEVQDYPEDFIYNFKPRYYIYEDGKVKINNDYEENLEKFNPPKIDLDKNTNGLDRELRNMFASMQLQLVQGNILVSQYSEQNARMAQEIVKIQKELEHLKEEK